MRRLAAALLAGLALAACSSTTRDEPEPAYPPITAAPPPAPTRPAFATPAGDACGARALQSLIGKSRTQAPVPLYPDRQRVACTSCPMTQDFRPDRLNILFDADTGLIRQVRCG